MQLIVGHAVEVTTLRPPPAALARAAGRPPWRQEGHRGPRGAQRESRALMHAQLSAESNFETWRTPRGLERREPLLFSWLLRTRHQARRSRRKSCGCALAPRLQHGATAAALHDGYRVPRTAPSHAISSRHWWCARSMRSMRLFARAIAAGSRACNASGSDRRIQSDGQRPPPRRWQRKNGRRNARRGRETQGGGREARVARRAGKQRSGQAARGRGLSRVEQRAVAPRTLELSVGRRVMS